MIGRSTDSLNEFLDAAELCALTGKSRVGDQARWLASQAMPHRLDGRRLIVSRYHARRWLEGEQIVSPGPNWDAVR